MAAGTYNRAKYNLGRKNISLDTDSFGVLLVSSAYIFDTNQVFVSEVASFELVGIGYERKILTAKSLYEDPVAGNVVWRAGDVIWNVASFGAPATAIFYLDAGDDLSRQLICCTEISPVADTNGNSFKLGLTNGILVME